MTFWIVAALPATPTAEAQVTRIVIDRAESPTYDGRIFGEAGQYEKLVGRAFGELDPGHPLNAGIQDIELAPRNERGKVEYVADFYLIKPLDMTRANGTLVYNIVNRGNKGHKNLGIAGGANDPTDPGDGLLEQGGFTMLWSGWQGEVLRTDGRMAIDVPIARHPDGSEVTGTVRAEYVVTEPVNSLALSESPYTAGTKVYEAVSLDNTTATLTMRVRENHARRPVPHSDWAFADCSESGFPGTPSATSICLRDGFDPNHIYELTYTARNPMVLGIGYAAIRDVISYFRHEGGDATLHPAANPLAGQIETALIWGRSQTGAALRAFLHLGFNEDLEGRRVAEGAHVLVAAGAQPLGVRFGQPGRAPFEHVQHLFPRAEAPVSWAPMYDPLTDRTGGILERCLQSGTCPKVMSTFSTVEYFNHRMSTNTTNPLATTDLALPDSVRMYLASSTPHGPFFFDWCEYAGNPNDAIYVHRAVFHALWEWVTKGTPPPPSRYPRLDDGTLVPPQELDWPPVPGITYTGLVNRMPVLDFGPEFRHADVSGIITKHPPRRTGREHPVLVPQVDADGNDIAGVRSGRMLAPTGSYTGFNYRAEGYGAGGLCDNQGSYVPFARTRAERVANGDPRLSLEERYGTHEGYVAAVRAAAEQLVAERYLLPRDAEALIEAAEAQNLGLR